MPELVYGLWPDNIEFLSLDTDEYVSYSLMNQVNVYNVDGTPVTVNDDSGY